MNIRILFDRLRVLVNPLPIIGGLEISDTFLRFLLLRGVTIVAHTVRLAPNIIQDGFIKDRTAFIAALQELRKVSAISEESFSVVVTIASSTVYLERMRVPRTADGLVSDSALQLNIRTIAPFDMASVYTGVELLQGNLSATEAEFLVAFSPRFLIDDMITTLRSINFLPIAIEPMPSALVRAFSVLLTSLSREDVLLLHMGSGGLDLFIVRAGTLLFYEFAPWPLVAEGEAARAIELPILEELLEREVQRMLVFYTQRWGGALHVLVSTRELPESLTQFIKKRLGLPTTVLSYAAYSGLTPQLLSSFGAALRGNVSRADDIALSLSPYSTQDDFLIARIRRFVFGWRNVLIGTLAFLSLLFLFVDGLLAQQEPMIRNELQSVTAPEVHAEVLALETQAAAFNNAVSAALSSLRGQRHFSEFFAVFGTYLGSDVSIQRMTLTLQGTGSRVVAALRATSEVAAIRLKNALTLDERFTDVVLPLATMTRDTSGAVLFQMTFVIKALL